MFSLSHSWLIGERENWKQEIFEEREMESLVSASAAGLGDDTLHVLDLSLATAEGTEL